MRKIIGIDVSRLKLNFCLLNDSFEIEKEGIVENNLIGFEEIINLVKVEETEVIFEPTGVYSRKLQYFLELNHCNYVLINPLLAKKEMDTLRTNKTDKLDAKKLAIIQIKNKYEFTAMDSSIYTELRFQHRYYQEINQDYVNAKNRLHKMLQLTFSEIEKLYSNKTVLFYKIIIEIPHASMIAGKNNEEVFLMLQDLLSVDKQSHVRRVNKLLELANKCAVATPINSVAVGQVVYWAKKVIELETVKNKIVEDMVSIASKLDEFEKISAIPGFGAVSTVGIIAEFGNIRRFKTPQKMNAYVGLDLRFNDSGQYKSNGFITKRGNSSARKILYLTALNMIKVSKITNVDNPVSRWYGYRSKNELNGKKKILMGAMDRMIRLIHKLVTTESTYTYII